MRLGNNHQRLSLSHDFHSCETWFLPFTPLHLWANILLRLKQIIIRFWLWSRTHVSITEANNINKNCSAAYLMVLCGSILSDYVRRPCWHLWTALSAHKQHISRTDLNGSWEPQTLLCHSHHRSHQIYPPLPPPIYNNINLIRTLHTKPLCMYDEIN